MDETISNETYLRYGTETPHGHALRLALVFFGAVLGFLVLGMVFGSSSARADDGGGAPDSLGSAVGGLVSDVTQPVNAAVTSVSHTVTHAAASVPAAKPVVAPIAQATQSVLPTAPAAAITSPVVQVADTAIAQLVGAGPLGDLLGDAPVATILEPVVGAIDGAVADGGDVIGSVTGVRVDSITLAASHTAAAFVASTASAVVVGVAYGTLEPGGAVGGTGPAALIDLSPSGTGMLAALTGGGFLVLLAMRRHHLTDRSLPGSPVFATDSTPD